MPELIAHRGASKYAPENTMEAFRLAYDLGAKIIECDIALTADEVPIIIHDDTLDRTTNAKGSISLYNWAYIRDLDAGSWFSHQYLGAKVPRLDEVIAFLQTHPCMINFELKSVVSQQIPIMLERVLECFNQLPNTDNLLISSFQFEILQAFHAKAPHIKLAGLSMKCQPAMIEKAYNLTCTQFSVSGSACTQKCIDMIHESGMKAGVFTVNQMDLYQQFKSFGVDYIFTDDLKISANISTQTNSFI
jgi:glycerophosphoryl diester phosphodiesterase